MNRSHPLKVFSLLMVLVLLQPAAESRETVYAQKAMVVAAEEHAVDIGVAVLRSGGNAVDAAVAVGFALAVTHPFAGNIGGGGFMLIRLADGRTTFIDFREKAPSRASRDMYLDSIGNPTEDSTVGWRSVGVPGTVRGLELAHQKYGHKPWAELVSPAINLARNGFPVSHAQMESWKYYDSLLSGREAGHLVSEHMGVAIVTGPAASDLQEKDLVVRPLSDKSLCFDTCLVMRRDDDSRAVNEFARTFLKQYAPQPRLTIQMQLPLPA